jgi:predicted small integral membrane protein
MEKQARRSYPEGSMKPSSLFIGAILIMSVGMAPYSYAADPSQDLVGWWTFDEGSGNTLFDASGNAYNGTIFGDPKWVSGRSGTALDQRQLF